MPDDCMLSFVFETEDNQLGLVNDAANRAAGEQVQDVIARFAGFDPPDTANRLGNGPNAVFEAALKKNGRDIGDQDGLPDGNGPPNLPDDGFLL